MRLTKGSKKNDQLILNNSISTQLNKFM